MVIIVPLRMYGTAIFLPIPSTYVRILLCDSICILGTASITNENAEVLISDLQCGVTYNIVAEGILNGISVGPGSSYGNITVSVMCM